MALSRKPQEIVEDSKNPLLAKHESWERVPVGDIADILNGFAFKSSKFTKDKGVPIIRIRDVGKDATETYYDGEFDETYLVDDGDLLVGMDGDFRSSIWKGGKALLNQRVCKISLKTDGYDFKFLSYVLQPYLDAIHAETSAVTVKHLSSRSISEIPLPLPPKEQQKRIVAKIEELFSHIDAGIEALKKAKQLLKQYRQSVLKAAVTGELTKEWRAANTTNLNNSQELYDWIISESENIYPNQIKEWEADLDEWKKNGEIGKKPSKPKKGPASVEITEEELKKKNTLSEGWCWVRLNDLCHVVRGGSPRPAGDPKYFGGDIPWITVAEITKDKNMYLTSVESFVTPLGKDNSRYLKPNTFLLTNSGATLGVPKISRIHGCINDGSVALLGINDTLKEYLYWYLTSLTEELRNINQGAAQPNLNTDIVRQILVPIGNESELVVVNQLIADKFDKIDRLEKDLEFQHAKAEKNKQSILASAFAGELVEGSA